MQGQYYIVPSRLRREWHHTRPSKSERKSGEHRQVGVKLIIRAHGCSAAPL
jgi:hypothetical protein